MEKVNYNISIDSFFIIFIIIIGIILILYLQNNKENNNSLYVSAYTKESIEICCTWGKELLDGILTYKINDNNLKLEKIVKDMLNEWEKNIDNLQFRESKSDNTDIEFIFTEDNGKIAGQTITIFDKNGFVKKNKVTISKMAFNEKLEIRIIKQVVKHEIGHVLGLGHANFDNNIMSPLIHNKEIKITKCEIDGVIKANEWKFDNKYYKNKIYKTESKIQICDN